MKPTLGRIVHYRDIGWQADEENWLAAMVIHVQGDGGLRLIAWDRFGSCYYLDNVREGTEEKCWRWPPREEG